jgi:hypothetical protein
VLLVAVKGFQYKMLADSGGTAAFSCTADGCLKEMLFWGQDLGVPDGSNYYPWAPPVDAYNPRPCPPSGPCAQPGPVPRPVHDFVKSVPRCGPTRLFLCFGGAR